MKPTEPQVALQPFNKLLRESIKTAMKLLEYFKLNLIWYQLVSGKGLEFDKLREYIVGDDVRRIDWKILARTKKLYIRAYKEERQYDIVFVFDVSNSMLLGTQQKTKNQYAAVAIGALAFAALEAGDNIGLVMASDRVNVVMEPDADYAPFMNLLAQKQNYGGQKRWKRVTDALVGNFDEESIIFILSDFIDTDPQLFLPELAHSFAKVYGIMVRDPTDDTLPEGVGHMYLTDPHGNKLTLTDLKKVKKEYEMLAKRQVEKCRDRFHAFDQLFFKVRTDEEFGQSFINAVGEEEVIN